MSVTHIPAFTSSIGARCPSATNDVGALEPTVEQKHWSLLTVAPPHLFHRSGHIFLHGPKDIYKETRNAESILLTSLFVLFSTLSSNSHSFVYSTTYSLYPQRKLPCSHSRPFSLLVSLPSLLSLLPLALSVDMTSQRLTPLR